VKTVSRNETKVRIINDEIELFIARILPNIKAKDITKAFADEKIGTVKHIEMFDRKNERGFNFKFAFLRVRLFNHSDRADLFRNVMMQNKIYFLYYDKRDYELHWQVKYRIPHEDRCYKKTVSMAKPYRNALPVEKDLVPYTMSDSEDGEEMDIIGCDNENDEEVKPEWDQEDEDPETVSKIYAEFEDLRLRRLMAEEDEQDYDWIQTQIYRQIVENQQMAEEDEDDYDWMQKQIYENFVY
jgi:hypothetical protein